MTIETILVTGGAGFIGSNFIHFTIASHPERRVINLDNLTYAGNLENLRDVEGSDKYRFKKGDVEDRELVSRLFDEERVDAVVNFAAESHVDRSIEEPSVFLRTNVLGTQCLLEASRAAGVSRFVQVSTDEVYGSLGETGLFVETMPLMPNSPYSASKAAADLLLRSYFKTYQFPGIITRCSNNYGPYQFPEKMIPLFISNAMEDREIPMYGDGLYVRDWIHVMDHCEAIDRVLQNGEPGEAYNIGGNNEHTNLDVTLEILRQLGKPESLIRSVKDRPGHDRRYAIDSSKIRRELGWTPKRSFTDGIAETIDWYVKNRQWWEKIKSGEYRAYYDRMYKGR